MTAFRPIEEAPKHRLQFRDDGMAARACMEYWTAAEHAIQEAVRAVESLGASPALTDAVVLLGRARGRVADHAEGVD